MAVYAVPSVLLLIIGPLARVTQLRFLENCSQSEAGSPPRQVGQEEGAGGNIICLDVLPAAPVGSMGQQDKVDEAGFLIEKQKTKMFVRAEHIYLAVYMVPSLLRFMVC
ncbi:unnamed protein product [Protopolystoma xenopodis]|uniref:Uncharacterized protein n=1 Tax=Protopolystoma xenopodis TaxID=117903 RepID=A0A3S5BBP9_9PLAT|nr:unnamed protein product [Protopolystoma xenopodis]